MKNEQTSARVAHFAAEALASNVIAVVLVVKKGKKIITWGMEVEAFRAICASALTQTKDKPKPARRKKV